MNKRGKRVWGKFFVWCFLVCSLAVSAAVTVFADMGPKPNVSVTLKNAPGQFYCIALLTKEGGRPEKEPGNDGLTGVKAELRDKVFAYEQNGWKLSFSRGGSGFLSFSDSYGYSQNPEYSFNYYAPSHFKVLLITEDGMEYVSNEITTTRFSAQCIYDVAAGTLTEDVEAYRKYDKTYVVTAMKYLVGTLLTEGLLLILFRLNQARNLPIFFIANILTQIYLHVGTWRYQVNQGGGLGYLGKFLGMEFLIILAECLLYAFFMKQKNEKHGRCIIYAIVANVVSAIAGLVYEIPISSAALVFIDLAVVMILLIAFSLDTKRNLVMAVLIHLGILLISYPVSFAVTKTLTTIGYNSMSAIHFFRIFLNGIAQGFYITLRSLGCAFLLKTKDGSKGIVRKVAYAMVTVITIWVITWLLQWANNYY